MSVAPLSKKKYFELELKMEFMNYTMQARSQGGGPPARFKKTEFAQNSEHAFLCYALVCMLVSVRNNLIF